MLSDSRGARRGTGKALLPPTEITPPGLRVDSLSCAVGSQPSPTQGFSHLSDTGFYVWLDSLPGIDSEISLGLLESWTSINETHSRPLAGCLATLFKSVACVL